MRCYSHRPWTMMHLLQSLVVLLSLVTVAESVGDLGIPGTTQTLRGYDTELGNSSICWTGRAAVNTAEESSSSLNKTNFTNKLVPDFVLEGETELLLECPSNRTQIEGFLPEEFGTPPSYRDGIRPRTREWYNYNVKASIDLTELEGNTIVSNTGDETATTAFVTVQVLLCELGRSGFCSPFVHEQANFRLKRQNITQQVQKGDRHGGTHVHSPFVFVEVSKTDPIQEFEVKVKMLVNDPGDFFAICAMNFFTSNGGDEAEYRYDVGNALSNRLVTYQDQPNVMEVSLGAQITVWTCSGLASLVILFLLIQTIRHRSNRVIQLSQGNFLICFLLAAFIASASVFLLEPKNDIYCNISQPLILIPLQVLYGVMIARLWRITAVISPVLALKKEEKDSSRRFVNILHSMTCCCAGGHDTTRKKKNSTRNLRKSITDTRLAWIVLLFTFPQVVIQTLSLVLQPKERIIEFNSDESKGRTHCQAYSRDGDDKLSPGQALETYGVVLMLLTLIMLMVVTTQSRNLPSLFNETRSMYDSTLLSILILLLGAGIIAVTDEPTTSPDVEYLLMAAVVLCMTLNTTLRIMLHKLRLVWRGEVVVVSQLVSDYKAKHKRKKIRKHRHPPQDPKAESHITVSGLSRSDGEDHQVVAPLHEGDHPKQDASAQDGQGAETVHVTETSDDSALESGINGAQNNKEEWMEEREEKTPMNTPKRYGSQRMPSGALRSMLSTKSWKLKRSQKLETTPQRRVTIQEQPDESLPIRPGPSAESSSIVDDSMLEESLMFAYNHDAQLSDVPIVIGSNETPTRRLVVPMFNLQRLLDQVNNRITSGSVVPPEEWQSLKEACENMGTTFSENVQFEWQQERNGDNSQDLA